MGASVPSKTFSAPGVMLSPDQQNAVTQQQVKLPNQPLNPNLIMNTNQVPQMAAPNATPSPILAGKSNNPNPIFNPLGYPMPGGNGGGYQNTLSPRALAQ
jgi:hypothetical protein